MHHHDIFPPTTNVRYADEDANIFFSGKQDRDFFYKRLEVFQSCFLFIFFISIPSCHDIDVKYKVSALPSLHCIAAYLHMLCLLNLDI